MIFRFMPILLRLSFLGKPLFVFLSTPAIMRWFEWEVLDPDQVLGFYWRKRNTMRLKIFAALVAITAICFGAVNPISQEALINYLEKGAPFDFILIDVRGSNEISEAIGNAACQPYNLAWPEEFQKETAKIPKDQAVIIYCRSGARAANASAYLEANGYTRVYNAGGFLTWTGPKIPPSQIKPASLLPEPSMKQSASGK
jgi:phage shock protein E